MGWPWRSKKQQQAASSDLSAVAVIVNDRGGIRVVVTQPWRLHHHLGESDRLFIVPGLWVREPVPWNEISSVVERAISHARKEMKS